MRAVIKVSGKLIQSSQLLRELASALSDFRNDELVLVHGGGPAISNMLKRLGIQPRFHAGQRVTDSQTLEIAEMVLSGKMGKAIVGALVQAKLPALGLSGRDAGLLQARPVSADNGKLGLVGEIIAVRADLLQALCRMGFVPVISPISTGPDGQALNVNADWAAAKVAAALKADWLLYFGDTPGVLLDGATVAVLKETDIADLIRRRKADSGMIPKLESALHASKAGVGQVRILQWQGRHTLKWIWRDGKNIGTVVTAKGSTDVASSNQGR